MNEVTWRKSSRSAESSTCVEVAVLPDCVLVRDSKNPDGPVLSFTYPEWRAFVGGATDGEFDL